MTTTKSRASQGRLERILKQTVAACKRHTETGNRFAYLLAECRWRAIGRLIQARRGEQ